MWLTRVSGRDQFQEYKLKMKKKLLQHLLEALRTYRKFCTSLLFMKYRKYTVEKKLNRIDTSRRRPEHICDKNSNPVQTKDTPLY